MMLLRYRPPERAVRRTDSQSAFCVVPNFRSFRVFLDVDSLGHSAAAKAIVCYSGEDDVWMRTNSARVPRQVKVDVRDPTGGVVSCEHSDGRLEWMSIAYWHTMIPLLKESVPKRHHAAARERLPLLMYARKSGCDLFVSECPSLAKFWNKNESSVPVVASPAEAMATLGLYLRLRENYAYRTHPQGSLGLGRVGYSWLASEVLVPSSGRTGKRFFSFVTRVSRILYARDRVHRCYFDTSGRGLDGEAFFYLDALLVSIVAAFDLLARIAHETLGLAAAPSNISWRKDRWVKDLRSKNTSLANLVRTGSKGRAVIDLCYTLRNHIHSDPLQGVAVESELRKLGVHLQLPHEQRALLHDAMMTLGGQWGTYQPDEEFYLVNVPLLTERLVASSAKLLDLMLLRLPGKRRVSRISVSQFPLRGQRSIVRVARLLLGVDPADAYRLRREPAKRSRKGRKRDA